MSNPGSNLLQRAARLIRLSPVPYYAYSSRTPNANRIWVSTYAAPVNVPMSVQRVPRDKYVEWGLEFQKNYVMLYASVDMIDLSRDAGSDQIFWGNRYYQIESENTWFEQDGWAKSLAVQLPSNAVAPS